MSSRELIFFDAHGAPYQPVKHFNRATGVSAYRIKPRGASNRTQDFLEVETIEEVARAMLVDGLSARVKAFSGGPVSVLRFGADTLVRYELEPAIAERLGIPARSGAEANKFAPELSRLKERFLTAFPDFDMVGAFAASHGQYHDSYRAKVDALLAASALHPEDGWAVLQDVVSASQGGRGALPLFFDGDVNWRVSRARDVDPAAFDAALNNLVLGADDPAAAVVAFNDVFKPKLDAIGDPNAFRDTRVVPSTVLAAVAPDRAISVRYLIYSNAERLLNQHTLFANKPISTAEYQAVLALGKQIRSALIAWGWSPRDLWDVHGFILATCADRNVDQAKPPPDAAVEDPTMPDPTNLILYGPPGTGKTYRTALEAVRLCGDRTKFPDSPDGRAALMAMYRNLVAARQIEFVTFHQNFSYEEFVEGLRPDTSGESGAGFQLKSHMGIFQRLADRASQPVRKIEDRFSLEGRSIFKLSLGQSNDPGSAWVYDEALEANYALLGFEDVDWTDSRFDKRDAILAELEQRIPGSRVTQQMGMVKSPDRFRNQIRIGDVVVISKGLNAFRAIGVIEGEYEYAPRAHGRYSHRRKVRWLWDDPEGLPVGEVSPGTRFSLDTVYEMPEARLNLLVLDRLINGSDGTAEDGELLPHVLIIDEINRANISKVFGELITLIEPDKRIGMPNGLTVRLPYSKVEFGVPANLHIIGTMNTADRSIALLDTALRRRFRFEELAPDASLLDERVDDVPLRAVLSTINRRIEYLLDRDHAIGHAFFMGKGGEDRDAIDDTMRFKVIPLLQEYFFEDWSRIHAVLGDGFIEGTILEAPPGIEARSERKSWRVRRSFTLDAYERLIGSTRNRGEATAEGEPEDAAA